MDMFGIALNVVTVVFTLLWAFTQWKLNKAEQQARHLHEALNSISLELFLIMQCLHSHGSTSEVISEMKNSPSMKLWNSLVKAGLVSGGKPQEATKSVH
jgi:hypothetical protein